MKVKGEVIEIMKKSGFIYGQKSFWTCFFLSFLLCTATLHVQPASCQLAGTISGRVTDSNTGTGVADATITAKGLSQKSNTTDIDGYYTISNLLPGDYAVTATASGYASESETAIVYSEVTTPVNFDLHMLSIIGKVYDAMTPNIGIAQANVTADSYSILTNLTGYYQLVDMPAGDYEVTAAAPGYASQSKQATVSLGTPDVVDFAMEQVPPGTIEGTITDASSGLQIDYASVFAYASAIEMSNQTDQNGHYTIEELPAWPSWNVEAYASGYISQSKIVAVDSGVTVTVDFVLEPFGAVDGVVTDSSTGLPVAEAVVRAGEYLNTTDTNGYYLLSDVVEETYTVTAAAPGYASQSEERKKVWAGEVTTVNFQLEPVPPGKIIGNVTDIRTGEQIAGATVTANDYSNTTDTNGNYVISNVPVWTYTVTALAPGYVSNNVTRTVPPAGNITANFELYPFTRVYVEPYFSSGKTSQNFTIKVKISEARITYKWSFYLIWNASLLNVTDIAEGDFLKGSLGDRPTSFNVVTYQDAGYINVTCSTSLPDIDYGVNGSGTLATITFLIEAKGTCDLKLYNVLLYDLDGYPSLPYAVRDGIFKTRPASQHSTTAGTGGSRRPLLTCDHYE